MPSVTPNYGLYQPLVNNPVDQDLWGGYLNDNMSVIDTTMKANANAITAAVASIIPIPIGAGLDWWTDTPPTNFLFSYGQAISRTTYSVLFGIWGTYYGVGDGSTTFNVPDVRGRVRFSKDNMGGVSANRLTASATGGISGSTLNNSGGEQAHTLLTAEMPAHTHTINSQGGYSSGTGYAAQSGILQTTLTTSSTGGGTAHNNVPPGIVCNYIIRVL